MCASRSATRRFCAAATAWKSPVKCRLTLSAGVRELFPPPVAPPLMPNTGPSDGWRRVTIVGFLLRRASASEMATVVLPAPKGVGVDADVTRMSLPRCRLFASRQSTLAQSPRRRTLDGGMRSDETMERMVAMRPSQARRYLCLPHQQGLRGVCELYLLLPEALQNSQVDGLLDVQIRVVVVARDVVHDFEVEREVAELLEVDAGQFGARLGGDNLFQDARYPLDLRERSLVHHPYREDRASALHLLMVVDQRLREVLVAYHQLVSFRRLQPRGLDADVLHCALLGSEDDEVARLEGLVQVDGERGEDVHQDVLEREGDRDAAHSEAGAEGGDVEPEVGEEQQECRGPEDDLRDRAEEVHDCDVLHLLALLAARHHLLRPVVDEPLHGLDSVVAHHDEGEVMQCTLDQRRSEHELECRHQRNQEVRRPSHPVDYLYDEVVHVRLGALAELPQAQHDDLLEDPQAGHHREEDRCRDDEIFHDDTRDGVSRQSSERDHAPS